jgi:hypothetical protein
MIPLPSLRAVENGAAIQRNKKSKYPKVYVINYYLDIKNSFDMPNISLDS